MARGPSLILRSPPSPNSSQSVFQILRSVVVTATDTPLLPYNFFLSTLNHISSVNSLLLTISVCVFNHRWIYCLSLPFHTHTINAKSENQPQFPIFATVQSPVPLLSFATVVFTLMSATRSFFFDTQASEHCLVPG